MKRDLIEIFIRKNREHFDSYEVPQSIWYEIDRQLSGKSKYRFSRYRLIKYAACAVVLFVSGFLVSNYYYQNQKVSKYITDGGIKQEFIETENFYQERVKMALDEYTLYKEEDDLSVINDLDHLDAAYMELRKELLSSGLRNEELIVHALIYNYQTKLKILQKVLEKIKEKPKSNKDEKNPI